MFENLRVRHGGVRRVRWTGGAAACALAGILAIPAGLAGGGAPGAAAASSNVIVTGPSANASALAVQQAGGTVAAKIPLVKGVVAELPEGVELSERFAVVPDRTFAFAATTATSTTLPISSVRATLGLPATGDEGRGVTVALLDTGVADVADLDGRLDHIDVTGFGLGDDYGHGTYLAGLIAGSGADSGGRYQGVAPGARILDVKVADATGATSLGLVLTGLQRVADTKSQYGTDVLNLSLSSGSPLPYQVDPLNQALRILWHQGLTVVAAAGNDGPEGGTVTSPGNDPTLVTVGGLDEEYSPIRSDDTVADWSGRGPTEQGVGKPDLVAPGAHVIGLRSPGSTVDATYPQARVGDSYVRGSGTSASAAVTSAAVADLLAANPELTPDQIKYLLTASAYRSPGLKEAQSAGYGGLDLKTALDLSSSPRRGPSGSTEAAPGRSDAWVALSDAFARGDRDAAVAAWKTLSPEARSWAARSWATLDPVARSWAARSWAATSWADGSVSSQDWAARSWAARSWAGEGWAARSWAARSWAGSDWVARSWAGDDWAARSWASDDWTARSWAAAWR